MELSDIIKYVADSGAMVIVFSFVAYFSWKWGNLQFEKHRRAIFDNEFPDIKNHIFFNKIDYFLDYKISRACFGCKGRSLVFKDMLTIMFKHWKIFGLKVANFKYTGKDCSKVSKFILSSMNSCINDYEKEWRENNIPEIVINKFNAWHNKKISFVGESVLLMANTSLFDTCNEKIANILSTYMVILSLVMLDVENVLKDINGELSGITYKNKRIK